VIPKRETKWGIGGNQDALITEEKWTWTISSTEWGNASNTKDTKDLKRIMGLSNGENEKTTFYSQRVFTS